MDVNCNSSGWWRHTTAGSNSSLCLFPLSPFVCQLCPLCPFVCVCLSATSIFTKTDVFSTSCSMLSGVRWYVFGMCVKSRSERLIVTYFPFNKGFLSEFKCNWQQINVSSWLSSDVIFSSISLSLSLQTHTHCPSFCLISQHWFVSVSRGIGRKNKERVTVPPSSTADWLTVNEQMNETMLRRGRGLCVISWQGLI